MVVRIEDLMQYAPRRTVETIASEMGYSKATEYPDEVLTEVQARYNKKRRSPALRSRQAVQQEALNTIHEDPTHIETVADKIEQPKSTKYPDEVLEVPSSKRQLSHAAVAEEVSQQETLNTAHEDLKDVDEGSQYRAAAMRVGGDALTLFYYATAEFTVPGLKEKVEESRNNLRQALKGVAAAYDPEHFLAQTHLAQMAAGRNGSMRSLNGNSSPSEASVPKDDSELSGSS